MTDKAKVLTIAAVLVLLLMAMIVFQGTGMKALQQYNDTKTSHFSMSKCDITLNDDFVEQGTYADGDVVSRTVTAKNDGTADAYIRIKAVFEDSDIADKCLLNINTTDYTYSSSDNYYYLKTKLLIGATSPELFSTITLGTGLPVDFSPDMIIYIEAVQAAGFANYTDAWSAFSGE